jgi:hypothetical protein
MKIVAVSFVNLSLVAVLFLLCVMTVAGAGLLIHGSRNPATTWTLTVAAALCVVGIVNALVAFNDRPRR